LRGTVDATVVDFAGLVPRAQAEAVRDADVLIGVHGAGLANAVHLRRGAVMVQLLPHKVHCRLPGSFCREAHQWLTRMALSAGAAVLEYADGVRDRTAYCSPGEMIGRCAPILGGPDVRVGKGPPLQRKWLDVDVAVGRDGFRALLGEAVAMIAHGPV
jgi:hypothetical protein